MTLSSLCCACAAIVLSSCVDPNEANLAIKFTYPRVQLCGRYRNQLEVEDVRQILELAQQRPEILKPINQIDVDQPGAAHVVGGTGEKSGDMLTWFDVQKRNGRWLIRQGSVHTGPIGIVTGWIHPEGLTRRCS
jgi:hypothetical protein